MEVSVGLATAVGAWVPVQRHVAVRAEEGVVLDVVGSPGVAADEGTDDQGGGLLRDEGGGGVETIVFADKAEGLAETAHSLADLSFEDGAAAAKALADGGWTDTNGNGIVDKVLDGKKTEAIIETLRKGQKPKAGPQNGRHTSEPEGGATTLKEINKVTFIEA